MTVKEACELYDSEQSINRLHEMLDWLFKNHTPEEIAERMVTKAERELSKKLEILTKAQVIELGLEMRYCVYWEDEINARKQIT